MSTTPGATRRWLEGAAAKGSRLLVSTLLVSSLGGCADEESDASVCPPALRGPDGDPYELVIDLPSSCSFNCDPACTEPGTPYDCPAMRPWATFPHAAECGCFDGQPPEPSSGICSATEPTGEALRRAGPLGPGQWVLPDGHLIAPAGVYASLDEDDLEGTFPMWMVPIEGTSLLLSSDGGVRDNALRLLDVTALIGGGDPSVAHLRFAKPSSLFHGLAWLPPATALASGGGDGMIYAFDVDTDLQTLSRDEARDIDLGGPTASSYGDSRWYAGSIAATGDGTRLLVAPSTAASRVQIRSLDEQSWGDSLGSISIEGSAIFDIVRDPFDPQGKIFYATVWDQSALVEIDADTQQVTRSLPLGKNPEGMAFLSAELMVVASADLDRLTVVDRVLWQERGQVDLRGGGDVYGHGPSALAYDSVRSRLFVTLSGVNALGVFDVTLAGSDATLTPVGRIPTAWWPTAVHVQDDGSLVVLAGKGTSTGPDFGTYDPGSGATTRLMHGGVQYVDVPAPTELDDWTDTAEDARQLARTAGYPVVECSGSEYDFPVPERPEDGPSELITNVLFIVRENKTYDAVFGALEGTDGDPDLVMAPGQMEEIWPNAHRLARQFSNFDNFYTDAEQSLQGHIWTTFGRTTDYIERAWLTAWGRGTRAPSAGILEVGRPDEGSLFEWLDRAQVPYANMGEIVGIGETPLDPDYPGVVTAIGLPDVNKSCYLAIRARAMCNLPPFSYVVMPNDHSFGGDAGAPHPGVMIAINDEATGMVVDALSHSPLWPGTLVIVTEDDPQDGADHVDVHRTLLFMASPWVKRGYLSRGHYDMSSVLKLMLTILGVPYPNEQIAQAALPLDAFTSTPDYTPYEYQPRIFDAPCNPAQTRASEAASEWDFSEVDDQPGIGHWVWRILHDKTYD